VQCFVRIGISVAKLASSFYTHIYIDGVECTVKFFMASKRLSSLEVRSRRTCVEDLPPFLESSHQRRHEAEKKIQK
jgi:hypothetical protein